jgi:hypothetical protein
LKRRERQKRAPPSHTFIEANEHDVVDNFWDSGRKKEEVKKQTDSSNNSNSNQSHNNVPDLLKWISDVTIKRRKFRRRYRCSHLLAEAVLSNTLRNARKDLALKQEEKRRKAHEFSYKLSIKFSKVEEESQVQDFNNNEQAQPDYNNSYNHANQENQTNKLNESSRMGTGRECEGQEDEQIQACMSSLDNFFSELKSIKV